MRIRTRSEMAADVEQITDPVAHHGEGPLWDPVSNTLLFVDMLAGNVLRLTDAGDVSRHHIGPVAAAIRPRRRGGFVAAGERVFLMLDDALRPHGAPVAAFDDDSIRMNDGGTDPQGRFYCGTMAYSEAEGAGTLYRLDPDLSVTTVLTGVTISNGLRWTSDGGRVLYNDTPTGRVDQFDFDGDTGRFSNRRPFATMAEGSGKPDGMAIDEEDGVWVAKWGGSRVEHYDSTGRLVESLSLPVSQVTACTFGGPDRRTLYITTSKEGLEPGKEPAAGAVFAARVDVPGAVEAAFAG
jgi:sugar lactone lactonase YvrE